MGLLRANVQSGRGRRPSARNTTSAGCYHRNGRTTLPADTAFDGSSVIPELQNRLHPSPTVSSPSNSSNKDGRRRIAENGRRLRNRSRSNPRMSSRMMQHQTAYGATGSPISLRSRSTKSIESEISWKSLGYVNGVLMCS